MSKDNLQRYRLMQAGQKIPAAPLTRNFPPPTHCHVCKEQVLIRATRQVVKFHHILPGVGGRPPIAICRECNSKMFKGEPKTEEGEQAQP